MKIIKDTHFSNEVANKCRTSENEEIVTVAYLQNLWN